MSKIIAALLILGSTYVLAEEAKVLTETQTTPVVVQVQTLDGVIGKSISTVVEKIKDTKGKVAVMDFPGLDGASTGLSAYISNKAGNKLIEVGRQVVDRSTLEKVISEQKLQQNSLMDAATAAKVGKLAGAGVFIIGNYTKTDTRFVLTIRALSVELGQFIPGAVAEETVKPLSKEFQDDLNEFLKLSSQTNNQIDLNGKSEGATSEVAPAIDPALLKKEVEFDTEVCKVIKETMSANKLYTLALKMKYLTVEELLESPADVEMKDATGENKWYSSQVGNWIYNTDDGGFSKARISEFVKGKSSQYKTKYWIYTGSHKISGLEKCSPNPGWWTEKRGN